MNEAVLSAFICDASAMQMWEHKGFDSDEEAQRVSRGQTGCQQVAQIRESHELLHFSKAISQGLGAQCGDSCGRTE